MAAGYVQVPPDSSGKKVDCVSLSAGGQTVVRQTVVIGDPTKSAGLAIVSGGQQLVKGAFTLSNNVNISAMPNVVLAAGANNIGSINNISRTVTVTGVVTLGAGAANIGVINNISAAVVIAAGANNIGQVNISIMPAVNISTMPAVVVTSITNQVQISNISATVNVAGTFTIGTIDKISATVTVAGSVTLAAGAANIGSINNISAAVVLAAGTAMIGAVSVGAIASITAPINISVMPAVVLAAGAANIGTIQAISATVNVNIAAQSAGVVLQVRGPVAHSLSVTAGNFPVLMGGRAHVSASANVSNLGSTYTWHDLNGRLIVQLNHPSLLPSASHGPRSVVVAGTAVTALVAAPGAGLSIYVTSLMVTNGSGTLTRGDFLTGANTASVEVVAWLAASGGGFNRDFSPPWKISANAALNGRIEPSVSASGVVACVQFFVGPT